MNYSNFVKKKDLDYENIRKIVCLDERIGESHTKVPGHDGNRGYGGTCFPKDINSLLNQIEKTNMDCYIIKAAVERNNKVDRENKEWEDDIGRSVI